MCVLVGVVTSFVLCVRVRGRVSRSCATENSYTPPRLEALFKLSGRRHSQAFVSFAPTSLRVLGALSNSSSCSTRSSSRSRSHRFSLLVVGSVAIHLVYVNTHLFLSLKIDQLRMLSRLSLDFTATGYTLYFMSAVL